jgi:hypothetical protein
MGAAETINTCGAKQAIFQQISPKKMPVLRRRYCEVFGIGTAL